MMHRIALAVLFLLAAMSTGWAQSSEPRLLGYTIDNLVDLYVEAALGREAGTSTEGEGVLAKWPHGDTVRIFPQPSANVIDREGPDLFIDETKRISDYLASLISDPKIITFDSQGLQGAARQAKANPTAAFYENTVAIYIGSRDELLGKMQQIKQQAEPLLPDYLIAAVANANKPACVGWNTALRETPSTLDRAFIFIEYADKAQLDACLYEEVMQSFGLPNDFPAGTPSIFNDDDVYSEPTQLDLLLWRVHADPRLKAGVAEPELRPLVRTIIKELLSGG